MGPIELAEEQRALAMALEDVWPTSGEDAAARVGQLTLAPPDVDAWEWLAERGDAVANTVCDYDFTYERPVAFEALRTSARAPAPSRAPRSDLRSRRSTFGR